MNMFTENTARLLITCEDRPGIVQAVSSFLYHQGANITALDQYATEAQGGQYFMRVEFELLWRHSRGSMPWEITQVISNHETLRDKVERFGIPFHVVPVDKDNKVEAYAKIDEMMQGNDLLVLARYMQILSEDFVEKWPQKIINIHHSFLPAFVGANPYKQAYEKGVKLIGATAHYVTADLDQGPIIEQDVERVSHDYSIEQLRELGEDVERNVLARAVRWHLEDRVIVDGNKTIVFD